MIRSVPASAGRGRLARSAAIALAIELLMAGGAAAWLMRAQPHEPQRAPPPPMQIALAAPQVPQALK
ncbi:hypothetical protein, partial [Burkholderia sp. Ac-20379]|uniref:hypothetical protein n=1 Tax=Burkholderia sp. Ac-20379 TaxID=2703900 RepID=UPI001980EA77